MGLAVVGLVYYHEFADGHRRACFERRILIFVAFQKHIMLCT